MTLHQDHPFVVSAYLKGIRGFDQQKAYKGLRKNHLPGGMMSKAGYEHNTAKGGGLEYYMERGYVPHPIGKNLYGFHQYGQYGSSQTLEYAYQDYDLAQMAKKMDKPDDYNPFIKRAENYKNIWNKESGWIWNRKLDGNRVEPVDILRCDNGWSEGNAAQYTRFVPHDMAGLTTLMGGRQAFTDKLNGSFEKAQEHELGYGKSRDQETKKEHSNVFVNYGNQPSMHTASLLNYSGAPWLTQYWTRQVVEKVYSGISLDYDYSGDEDQEQMGSLAVLLKIGLFSTNGGTAPNPFYKITSPVFNKITIDLDPRYYKGETFVINARNITAKNGYIQSAKINGKPLDRPWISHETVVNGGTLTLQMGAAPNKSWGSKPDQAPASMSSPVK